MERDPLTLLKRRSCRELLRRSKLSTRVLARHAGPPSAGRTCLIEYASLARYGTYFAGFLSEASAASTSAGLALRVS